MAPITDNRRGLANSTSEGKMVSFATGLILIGLVGTIWAAAGFALGVWTVSKRDCDDCDLCEKHD